MLLETNQGRVYKLTCGRAESNVMTAVIDRQQVLVAPQCSANTAMPSFCGRVCRVCADQKLYGSDFSKVSAAL